ncbi:MAG: hypothetical protein IJW46_04670 [Clostridia bacterium]|nr:hypothetical protein [Clostridia bacterium]
MKKRSLIMTALIILICLCTVGLTIAYLTAVSNSVTNTFTVGNITLELSETARERYPLIPGAELHKDPRVTVKSGSEAAWLYVKLEEANGLEDYVSYALSDGWTLLDGYDNVYYREVSAASADTVYPILQNDTVTVKDTLTEEALVAISNTPTLTVSAYAIQRSGVATALVGWQALEASS